MRTRTLIVLVVVSLPVALAGAPRETNAALPAAVSSSGNWAVMDNGDFYEYEGPGSYVASGNLFSGGPPTSRIVAITDDFKIVLANGEFYIPITPTRPYTFMLSGNLMDGWQDVCADGQIVSMAGNLTASFAFLTSCGDVISHDLRGRIGAPVGVEERTWSSLKQTFK